MSSAQPGTGGQSLTGLFHGCTVRVLQASASGTGFFVAPGLVLTCAHLVEDAGAAAIRVTWKDRDLQVKAVRKPPAPQEAPEPPDLALLEVEETLHPCVLLHGAAAVRDPLYCYGYPGSPSGDGSSRSDPVTMELEGFTETPRLLKFKNGQIQPGHSGSPILNLRTGAVCGLVSWTRGALHLPSRLQPFILDIGGLGEPTATLLASYPEIVAPNAGFHTRDDRWIRLLSPEQRQALEEASGRRGRGRIWSAASLLTPLLISILLQPGVPVSGDLPASLYGPWELIGPAWAFVQAVTPDPQDPRTVYVALGEGQGVFSSEDGGLSWEPRNVGLSDPTVMDIRVSPQNGTLYAATRNGMWISRDRGQTWTNGTERYSGKEVLSITLSPHDPKFLLVGTLYPGGASAGAGSGVAGAKISRDLASSSANAGHLHITQDGGQSWLTFPMKTVNDASVAYSDSRITYIASADSGLFRTLDGFETIERVDSFPGRQPLSVAVAPHDSGIILVGTLHTGLYQSFDGGESWNKAEPIGDVQVSEITFSQTDSRHVLVATRTGVFESLDGGRAWQPAPDGLIYSWILSVTATKDGALLAGASGGGVYRRAQGQKNWVLHNDGFPAAEVMVLAAADRQNLFAGTPLGLFRSRDAGESWRFMAFPGEAVMAIALPVPRTRMSPGTGGLNISFDEGRSVQEIPMAGARLEVYVGTRSGRVYRSPDAGATWSELTLPALRPGPKRLRGLVVVEGTPHLLYVVIEHSGILRSADGGATWSVIGEQTCGGMINTLFVSPHDPRLLYAATADRGICISRDGGEIWEVASGLDEKEITAVVEPRQVPGLTFATGVSRAVYRSHDQGRTWEVLRPAAQSPETGKKARRWATLGVSADGSRLALGTPSGVWLSRDGGESWEPLPGGMLGKGYYVNQLFFDADDNKTLYAGMIGGAFRARFEE